MKILKNHNIYIVDVLLLLLEANMRQKCKKCGRDWNYLGKKKVGSYVTCPDCKTPFKLEVYKR